MVETFTAYYRNLYQADPLSPHGDLQQFVHDLPVSRLSPEDREFLEADVTDEELQALGQLHSGKVPGPNGFQPEYWCLVLPHLGQPMLDMFQEALEKGILPPDL
ncbi:hypothetical protein NDU88_005236 [Pleurodeles waltl]|uniref:Uncharacterized protein n=1 Tax=Pleurodeles waltl TaxID=8319 RepID=A0AAV7QFE6_PLEWA|nr:hypothetical protein NDU88_005236 [Pleurodeles waltl]